MLFLKIVEKSKKTKDLNVLRMWQKYFWTVQLLLKNCLVKTKYVAALLRQCWQNSYDNKQ